MHSHNRSSNKFSYEEQFKAGLYRLWSTSNFTAPWIREVSASGQRHGPASDCISLLCGLVQSETCWHSATSTGPVASTNTTEQCTQSRPNGTLDLRHIQLLCVLCACACWDTCPTYTRHSTTFTVLTELYDMNKERLTCRPRLYFRT
jgi:hypothetical protein